MKQLLFLILLISSFSLNAQKLPETCNGLPYAKVDTKASLTSDTESTIKKELPSDMKKGEHNATFKLYVTCKGDIDKHMYQNGDLSEDAQNWMTAIIGKTTWKAAVKDGIYVTSTVFVQVEIKNGQVKVTVP